MSALHSLFNYPVTKRVAPLWLNAGAVNLFHEDEPNPLLDTHFCAAWIEHLHRIERLDFSYGGYMEDRAFLWRGSYLDPHASIHLGIDVNVPAGTAVYCPAFTVLDCLYDTDQNGGWGTRLTVQLKTGGIVVFAHLDEVFGLRRGTVSDYRHPQYIGEVAVPERNGGWYPHLHLQGLASRDQLAGLDGYGPDRPDNMALYPNPLKLLDITT